MMVSGPVGAKDGMGDWAAIGHKSCQYYLDAYSRTALTGTGTINGPFEFWKASGWISGFISAYNFHAKNGKENVAAGMPITNIYRWVDSWCRDNPSKDIADATLALISKLEW